MLAQTRLGSLKPYESEAERFEREKRQHIAGQPVTLDAFLMRHDPDPARAMNVLLSWTKDPKAHDAATFIQRRARGFLARASRDNRRREWHQNQGNTVLLVAAV